MIGGDAILAFLAAKFGAKVAITIFTSLTIVQILTVGFLTGTLGFAFAASYIMGLVGFVVWHCI